MGQQTDLCLSAFLDHSMSTLYLVFARELYSAAAASYNLQSLYHMYRKLREPLGVPALHAFTKKMLGVSRPFALRVPLGLHFGPPPTPQC